MMAAKEKEVLFEEILEAWLEEIYQTREFDTSIKEKSLKALI